MNKIDIIKKKIAKLVNQFNVGNYTHVIQEVNILLKKLPNNSFLLNLLGSCYQKLGRYETAGKNFLQVLSTEPKNLAAMNNLANTHKDLFEFEKAENLYKKIIKINPKYIMAITNYANLKFQLNQHDDAINLYNQALEIDSKSENIHYNIGLTFQSLGNFKKAEYHFNEMIKINPSATMADRLISRFTKYDKNNNHLKEMIERSKRENLNDISKINLYFALSKAFEDIKEFEESYKFMKKANDLTNSKFHYDKNSDDKFTKDSEKFFNLINNYDNNFFKKNSKKIIFILGLPRSGTSLAEQIISSHNLVYGAGELNYLENLIKKKFFLNNELNLNLASKDKFNNLAYETSNEYLDLIGNFKTKKNIIIDKAPHNFKWIGFISLIFPNAKIVHCSRNPKDNFLSLYKNFFPEGLECAYNEENLINFFKNYKIMMNYWKKKFPHNIYDLIYEDLINKSDEEIKKLIKFCELEWDDNCLKFYDTKSSIKTLSVAEARKPIYKSSLSSADNFKKYLQNSFDKLENL